MRMGTTRWLRKFELRMPRSIQDGGGFAAASILFIVARDAWRVSEFGGERGDKRGKGNSASLGGLPGQVSSVSDGDRDDKYADCRGGVFCQVIRESL